MNIALIAHDKKKQKMIALCEKYKDVLAKHTLYATGTTGLMVMGATGLEISQMKSGPLGGDQQIGSMVADGKMKNVSKEKGRKKALAHLINKVEEIGQDVKNHKIIIGHTDAIELAYELEGLLKEKLGNDLDIDFVIVNPTCGSHCGPDAVGISFYSKCR